MFFEKSTNYLLIIAITAQVVCANGDKSLEENRQVLEPLKNKFGNAGEILYWLFTSPFALGGEISASTGIVTRDIGLEANKQQIGEVLDILSQADYATIMKPLYEQVKGITDPVSQMTAGEAFDTLYSIFDDKETAEEFLNRLKNVETVNAEQQL